MLMLSELIPKRLNADDNWDGFFEWLLVLDVPLKIRIALYLYQSGKSQFDSMDDEGWLAEAENYYRDWKEAPINFKIIKGTPNHSNPSLCFSCANSHVFEGQAVSSLRVRCEGVYEQPIWIKEPIVECSEYRRRTDPDLKQMHEIAWILETKKGRTVGFVPASAHKQKIKDGDADRRTDAETHEVEDDSDY